MAVEPILRWAGSKRKILPELVHLKPTSYRRYFEPFCGSACLFLSLNGPSAVLNDLNSQLVETYRAIRFAPAKVWRIAAHWTTDADTYYSVRRTSVDTLDRFERAARFVYLNRLCFNGVYRTNRAGAFNVPIGQHTGRIPPESAFRHFARRLRHAELRSTDFEAAVGDVGAADFVYLDPPYTSASRAAYGEYGYGSFAANDIDRLTDTIERIDQSGAYFLLSYRSDARLRAKLNRFRISRLSVRRQIAGFAAARSMDEEILITNISQRTRR